MGIGGTYFVVRLFSGYLLNYELGFSEIPELVCCLYKNVPVQESAQLVLNPQHLCSCWYMSQ